MFKNWCSHPVGLIKDDSHSSIKSSLICHLIKIGDLDLVRWSDYYSSSSAIMKDISIWFSLACSCRTSSIHHSAFASNKYLEDMIEEFCSNQVRVIVIDITIIDWATLMTNLDVACWVSNMLDLAFPSRGSFHKNFANNTLCMNILKNEILLLFGGNLLHSKSFLNKLILQLFDSFILYGLVKSLGQVDQKCMNEDAFKILVLRSNDRDGQWVRILEAGFELSFHGVNCFLSSNIDEWLNVS